MPFWSVLVKASSDIRQSNFSHACQKFIESTVLGANSSNKLAAPGAGPHVGV
jgi:hypothetical protein